MSVDIQNVIAFDWLEELWIDIFDIAVWEISSLDMRRLSQIFFDSGVITNLAFVSGFNLHTGFKYFLKLRN